MSQNVLDLIITQLGSFDAFQPDDGLGQKVGGQTWKKRAGETEMFQPQVFGLNYLAEECCHLGI